MTPEALKGHLDLLLLAVLTDGPTHGYAIINELRTRSGDTFDLPEGTVYPALHRLQRAGYVTSTWTTANGRRRRVYTLTDRGSAAFATERRAWQEFATSVQQVLGGRPWPTTA